MPLNYLDPNQSLRSGAETGQALGEAIVAPPVEVKEAAYNALARIYGPDAAAALRGAPAEFTKGSEAQLQAAQTGEAAARTAYQNALTPGAAASQAAQTGEATARTAGLTQQQKIVALGQHVNTANGLLAPDGSNADQVWQTVGPQLKQDLGLDDAGFEQARQLFVQDPHGELSRVAGMLPKTGIGVAPAGGYTYTAENPLTGGIAPAPNPANISPFLKQQGAPQFYTDKAGNSHTVTFDEAGAPKENGAPLGQIPADWTPKQITAVNIQNARQQETERHDVATEGVAQGRLALAERVAQPLSAEDATFYGQRFNETGQLPPMGMGGAFQRVQILKAARADAEANGDTAKSLVAHQQEVKATGAYRTDLSKSTPNSAGGRIVAADATLTHMDLMDKYIDALGNKNFRLANSISQEFKKQTGQLAPAQFDAQKKLVADELGRYIITSGGGVTDRQQLQDDLSKANSPTALRGVLNTWRQDIGGKLAGQRQQAQALGATDSFDAHLSPTARSVLGVQSPQAGGAGPALQDLVNEARRRKLVQ